MNDIRKKALEQTKDKLSSAEKRDMLIVKTVNQLEQEKRSIHESVQRFRDWYSLYFPELAEEISEDEHFLHILSNGLKREELESFKELAENSTGADIAESDLEMMETVFESITSREDVIEDLENYIENATEEEVPNLEAVLGPILTAKVLSHAGGLEELAKKPASTVQVLGAEKALFRYLKGEGTPPKHGVLFEHDYVSKLPESNRGKMARFIANKAVMAARLDQYGDKFKGDDLRREVNEKFQELSK